MCAKVNRSYKTEPTHMEEKREARQARFQKMHGRNLGPEIRLARKVWLKQHRNTSPE